MKCSIYLDVLTALHGIPYKFRVKPPSRQLVCRYYDLHPSRTGKMARPDYDRNLAKPGRRDRVFRDGDLQTRADSHHVLVVDVHPLVPV